MGPHPVSESTDRDTNGKLQRQPGEIACPWIWTDHYCETLESEYPRKAGKLESEYPRPALTKKSIS
jgi:hypothetical protein